MTNTAPIALMAAALFLAMQGQPRADETVGAKCPCGFTAEALASLGWFGMFECTNGKLGDLTQLVDLTWEVGDPAIVAHQYLSGGVCFRMSVDESLEDGKERFLNDAQMKACSHMIIDYAQKLKDQKDAWWVHVVDNGCNLK